MPQEHSTPGFFDWQYSGSTDAEMLFETARFDPDRYGGGFQPDDGPAPDWSIGPFLRERSNPVLSPSADGWDRGRFGGGVHNGSVVRHGGRFVYVYRGEAPLPVDYWGDTSPARTDMQTIDYICDIGVAVSDDGVTFERVRGQLFRRGEDARYSFEDVCLVRDEAGGYVLFCNRWDWSDHENPAGNGVWIARSDDLWTWTAVGPAFPGATRMHRNACVLQSPTNDAVRVDGRYVMYLNDGLVAFSDDLVAWTSEPAATTWPGGENCFALTGHDPDQPDAIVVFTGGHHSGHFYAIGEVLLSRSAPSTVIAVMGHPVLAADPAVPWEHGMSAEDPSIEVSYFRDTIFFTGMTRHDGVWWLYYGGSEYYTCLARSVAR